MKDKPLIYIIGGSIRNRASEEQIVKKVEALKSEAFLYEYIEHLGREKKISNSEGCAIAAAFGASQQNVDIRYLRLNDYFLRTGKRRRIDQLFGILKKADGMVFALPVYFGDRSSLFHEFVEQWQAKNIEFKDKIFGFISVGAKRNGGQETTNVYGMQSVTQLGGLVVGNGPPTSQFGGTTVGGNIGTMENDYFGIMTSYGTGSKVAETARILKIGKAKAKKNNKKIRITFLILQEYDSILESTIKTLIKEVNSKNVEFKILNLTNYNFHRCYACNVCPSRDIRGKYRCINPKDDMKKLHDKIINNDGIILSGLCKKDLSKLKSVYQIFIERTRYIRRDDFKLTNRLTTAFSINELGTHCLFNLRVLTSFLRHNTIIHKGMSDYLHNGEIIECGSIPILENFVEHTRYVSLGRESVEVRPTHYDPVGY
ncbi:NAD(P)H-dependent oxidoreductase [[Eubacterium] cellulosolvens]